MNRKHFTNSDVDEIIQKYQSGVSITELCAEHGISPTTLYKWKRQFGYSSSTELTTLSRLQKENRRLRRQVLELTQEVDKFKGKMRTHMSNRAGAVVKCEERQFLQSP